MQPQAKNPKLHYGRIVKAEVTDPQGNHPGPHYMVIITKTDEIDPKKKFECVVITSKFPGHLKSDDKVHVFLPWHRAGHTETKLKKKCTALCSWFERITDADIQSFGGNVPPGHMVRIMERVKLLRPESPAPEQIESQEKNNDPTMPDHSTPNN